MTTRGKIVLTIILLGVVGFGVYRWWDKIAPQSRPQNQSLDIPKVQKELADGKRVPADIPLLIGTNAATMVERSAIPAVSGVSDYVKNMKDGKLIVEFPINVWPGWAPIIVANAGMEPSGALGGTGVVVGSGGFEVAAGNGDLILRVQAKIIGVRHEESNVDLKSSAVKYSAIRADGRPVRR